ncbi:MAG: NAD(P)H-dependent glycerol-3-phosphate dehydrogenase [Ekhidna sp.]|uniref:NAD(P)H-dependent glycerol-3-phosphate dehydrogenase n=1 Tax=Ekhidna sp. TaxID=2608089 RepID=UPI0032EF6ED1
MGSKDTSETIGVIGAGSFGTAISNILAENNSHVILYVRDPEKAKRIAKERISSKQKLHENIEVTNVLEEIPQRCEVIFPMVPSANFRDMIIELAPHLRPYHVLIHGTKGFDLYVPKKQKIDKNNPLTREHVKTVSEVIKEETSVLRVGCLAGPNLARELDQRKPAATVVASHFDEVIRIGQRLLKNDRFMIYGSRDLIGIELCGILKNIIAVGAGTIAGMNLGENAKSLFISRGLVEMVYIGKALGGNAQAFLGLAGVGDLIATCTSNLSRNFTVGYRLAKGETLDQIIESMDEVAEGVKTINIVNQLAESYKVRCPITETLYGIIHNQRTIQEAHTYLMNFPFRAEIDFLDPIED